MISFAGLLLSVALRPTQADTQRVYSEDQFTLTPVVLRQAAADYPDSLKRAGIGGTVCVSVVLDRKGRPDSGSVRTLSTPDTVLNAPARAAVLGAHFTPGRVGERRVRVLLKLGVAFDPVDTATAPSPIDGLYDSLTQKPAGRWHAGV